MSTNAEPDTRWAARLIPVGSKGKTTVGCDNKLARDMEEAH